MDDKPISSKDFLTFMNTFKTNMEKSVKNIDRKLDAKMNKIDEDIKDLKDEVKAKDKKMDDMNNFLTGRMSKLEQDLKRMHHGRMKSDTLGIKPSEKTKEVEIPIPTGWKDNGDLGLTRQNSWADEVAKEMDATSDRDNKRTEKTRESDKKQWLTKRTVPTCWTEEVEVITSPENTAADAAAKNAEINRDKIEKQKRLAIKNWFGYEYESEEETSEDENETENEAEWNTVNRKEKKQMKETRNRKKRKQKMEETARKAQFMVGIGPIGEKCFNEHIEKEHDYEKAKINMVNSYLKTVYKYNEFERKKINIMGTKISIKQDIFIYIALDNLEDIKDIYRRKAEIRRDDTILRSYVPPQFYERFVTLNRICKEKRDQNSDLKTQIRFGKKDLEILTKTKGTDEPFTKVDLNDFTEGTIVPEFDHKISWKQKTDRIPRRRVTSSRSNSRDSSPAGTANWEKPTTESTNTENQNRAKPLRIPSWKSTGLPSNKKQQQESTMDSCHSSDMNAVMDNKNQEENEDMNITQ